MKTILAAMSAAIAILALAQKNWMLAIYWLMVEFYWLINSHKDKKGK